MVPELLRQFHSTKARYLIQVGLSHSMTMPCPVLFRIQLASYKAFQMRYYLFISQ